MSVLLVPTFHPAFLLRKNRRLTGVVLHDLQRAVGYADGNRPKWSRDEYLTMPPAKTVRDVLRSMRGHRVAVDIETNGRHPLVCDVRTIGFYDGKVGISIPRLHRDGTTRQVIKPGRKRATTVPNWVPYYSAKDWAIIHKEMNDLFDNKGVEFDAWNGQFDSLCSRKRLDLRFRYDFDGMLAHHVVLPYLAHGLGFVGSLYTEIPFYKETDKGEAWSSGTDLDLARYNIDDCKVTWIVCGVLREELSERDGDWDIYRDDLRYVRECETWKEHGFAVDTDALELLRAKYSEAAAAALAQMRAIVGNGPIGVLRDELLEQIDEEERVDYDDTRLSEMFKPGSLPKLRKVLVSLGVPLTQLTESGTYSTAADYLLETRRQLLQTGAGNTDVRVAFLDYLFAWREASKIVGTFLQPEILPDGRLHPTYTIHVTPTGRLNSKAPNFQNQTKGVRGMYVARVGHLLVCGDWDSLELRIIGYISEDQYIITAFDNYDAGKGAKIHKLNTNAIFGVPLDADFDAPEIAPLYRAAKAVQYGINYGAGVKTAFESARKEMPDLTEGQFTPIYDGFRKTMPRLFEWQKEWVSLGMRQGWLDSPIRGRRSYYFERGYADTFGNSDTPEAAKMLNFPIQSGAADIVTIANFRVLDRVVATYQRLLHDDEVCRQLAQIHDELIFEVPARLAEQFAKDFKRVAEEPPDMGEHRHWRLPVDVKVVERWGKLPKQKEAA